LFLNAFDEYLARRALEQAKHRRGVLECSFPNEEREMKSQTRATKRKRQNGQPERYLLRLRKKLGVRTLTETKRREVEKALSVTQGDKVLAAALLGIGKTTVYRTLEEL
jgi:transcriptional regulator of acetoin/glycerol metabolism